MQLNRLVLRAIKRLKNRLANKGSESKMKLSRHKSKKWLRKLIQLNRTALIQCLN